MKDRCWCSTARREDFVTLQWVETVVVASQVEWEGVVALLGGEEELVAPQGEVVQGVASQRWGEGYFAPHGGGEDIDAPQGRDWKGVAWQGGVDVVPQWWGKGSVSVPPAQRHCPSKAASVSTRAVSLSHIEQRPYLTNSASMSNQGSVRVQIEQRLCPTSSASFSHLPMQRPCPTRAASLSR